MKIKFLDFIYTKYQTNPLLIKTLGIFSFFSALFVISPFLNIVLKINPEIKDFSNHVISNATLFDFDVASRVSLYYRCLIVIFCATIITFLFLFYLVNKKYKNTINNELLKVVQQISVIGIASIFAGIFIIQVDLASIFIIFLGIYYLFNLSYNDKIIKNNGLWVLIISISLTFPLYYSPFVENIFTFLPKNLYIFDTELPFSTTALVFYIIFCIIALIGSLFIKLFTRKLNVENQFNSLNNLYLATIPISFYPILFSILIELLNAINVRFGFTFNHPSLLFFFFLIVSIGLAFIYFKRLQNKQTIIEYNPITKYHFLFAVLSLAFIVTQPWRMISPEDEFFEMANHGLSVDHFFRYGSIPIIETFDAHMLSNQFFAYIYSFVNGYEPWSPFLYNTYLTLISYLLVFYLFKRLLGSFYAFIVVLTFPLLGTITTSIFSYPIIIALSLINLYNNKTRKQFYIFWLSIVILCLFRLDLGFAGSIAGITAYFVLHIITRKNLHLKTFISTGFIVGCVIALLYVFLCLIKGINPITRILDFLYVSMSNQNFAIYNLGDSSSVIYRIIYYTIPLLTLALLVKIILKSYFSKNFISNILADTKRTSALLFFIFFALFFYFNIPRGIVRHNLYYDVVYVFFSTIPIAAISYIFIKYRKNNLAYFLALLIVTYYLLNLNKTTLENRDNSLTSKALLSTSFKEKFTDVANFNHTRIHESFSFSDIHRFKETIDQLLQAEETYFDFSSTNYYHALVGRKNPNYVNQTPILLNGDKPQEETIKILKEHKIPIVLMPFKNGRWNYIDDVPIEFKYYKLTEFIYENYTPLMNFNLFSVYVLKDKKASFDKILNNSGRDSKDFTLSNFDENLINKLEKHQIILEKDSNNHLVLTQDGTDPFFLGFYKKNDKNISSPQEVKIKFTALSTGRLQVFYITIGNPDFNEENSKSFEFPTNGEYEFYFNTNTPIEDLRIDLDAPKIVINEIKVSEKSVVIDNNTSVEVENYSLGNIPYVWGSLADKKLFSNVETLENPLNNSSYLINVNMKNNQYKPYFLYFEVETDTILDIKAEAYNDKNVKLIDYFIKTKKGKHQYAVRMSANKYWWNQTISKVGISSYKPFSITKFALISEDNKNNYSLKSNEYFLSNITDENWIGGVSTNSNILLFDNTENIRKLLKNKKRIRLENNTILNISNYSINGDYIHVNIVENLKTYTPQISYPNRLTIM